MRWYGAVALMLSGMAATPAAPAVGPPNVFLLVNKNLPASREVAQHYCAKRGVPAENVIPLDVPDADEISRDDFNRRIREPVRAALQGRRKDAKVLLSVYGVPLRVGPQIPSEADRAELAKLRPQLDDAQIEHQKLLRAVRVLQGELRNDPKSPLAAALPDKQAQEQAAQQRVKELEAIQNRLLHVESQASVDSELMLLWWDSYPLHHWVYNPLYWQMPDAYRQANPPVLMTARLDGPNPEIAKRLVDDALAAERTGLSGKVYIDARGLEPYNPQADKYGTGYNAYDQSFRELTLLLAKDAKMEVKLDDQEALFLPGYCRDCALYCGWYALSNYTPCCKFVKGAVAWHLASLEAVSLRNPGKQWAGNLLRDGAAATLGPVAEPYAVGFPKPAEFFGFLVTGEFTLVEVYARTTLLTSWQMVLVGDPLYNPYAKAPKLQSWEVLPSPRGAATFSPVGG